jgi:hypothetical protein
MIAYDFHPLNISIIYIFFVKLAIKKGDLPAKFGFMHNSGSILYIVCAAYIFYYKQLK